jgi:outer membrane protein assembly factor BamD
MRRFVLLLLVATAVSGCGSILDETKDWTAERFYQEAKDRLNAGNYDESIKLFEQLQGRYPYGRYAEQAQLEIAYAQYKYDEPALAIAACDRFIRQYPTHPNVDYAYYLKGVVNFHGKKSFMNWLVGSNDDLHDRDVRATRESYEAFKEVVQRFPNSRYAEDARLRMNHQFNVLAKYEISVARYYYERGAYVAAVNRARHALENFPRTPATEDALAIQAMAYKRMNLQRLHDDTVRVLTLNFPDSHYLQDIKALGGA